MRIARSTPAQKPRGRRDQQIERRKAAFDGAERIEFRLGHVGQALRDCLPARKALPMIHARPPRSGALLGIATLSIVKRLPLALVLLPLVATGCAHDNDITAVGGSIGREVKRTSCPAVGVPAYTGDVTLFDPPASRDARAIDVVATITDVQSQCDDSDASSPTLASHATFRVARPAERSARRARRGAALFRGGAARPDGSCVEVDQPRLGAFRRRQAARRRRPGRPAPPSAAPTRRCRTTFATA